MPSVKPGESQSSYMGRCMHETKKENMPHKAAVGKCMGMYASKWKRKKGFGAERRK